MGVNWHTVSAKHAHCCACCRYFYDPTNSAIRPKHGFWEYDPQAVSVCIKRNGVKTKSFGRCKDFESKLI